MGALVLEPAIAAHAAVGTRISDAELARVDGQGSARIFGDSKATVIVFFRPGQDHSTQALRQLSRCRKALATKPVRWVGLVSDSSPREAASAMLRESGLEATALIDAGDAVYGSLGVALHPVVVIANEARRLAAFEPFRSVDFCPTVSAQVRHALGEISDGQLRAALEPDQSPALGQGSGKRYRVLAEALLRSGNAEKALENARRSVELEPGSAASHALLGAILAERGDCVAAEPSLRHALAIDAGSESARVALERCRAAR